MKKLIELANLLTRKKTATISIIGDKRFQGTKMDELYQAIIEGNVKTDEKAALLLYGKEEVNAKYRNLKKELRKKLLNTLYFVQTNKEKRGERAAAKAKAWRMWTQNRFCVSHSAYQMADDLAKKVLKIALKHNFTELVVLSAASLKSFYGLKKQSKKDYLYYKAIWEEYTEIQKWEELADSSYQDIIVEFTLNKIYFDPQMKVEVNKKLSVLLPQKGKILSPKFQMRLFSLRLLGSMGTYDYSTSKKISIEAIQYIKNRKDRLRFGLDVYLMQKLVCHTQLLELDEAQTTATELTGLLEEGTFNWFKAHEYLFTLAMRSANYQKGYEMHKKLCYHPLFNQFSFFFKETWALFQGYLYFLMKVEKIQPTADDRRFDNFKMRRFLNEVPAFAKDKSGRNISVLILQTLLLLAENKRDQALDRIEAVEKYRIRYTDKVEHFRADCFIKMLLLIPKEDFRAPPIEQKAKRYLEEMKTVQINFSNQSHEAEILPYPDTWKWTLYLIRRLK